MHGTVIETPFGYFHYRKDSSPLRYRVTAHIVEVSLVAPRFPEKDIRRTQWFSMAVALREVGRPEIRDLLASLPTAETCRSSAL